MIYFITYDLNKAGKDYDGVVSAIKTASNGKWCRPCESAWLIQSNFGSAQSIYELIAPHLDSDDTCLVIEVKNNYFGYLNKEVIQYMQTDLGLR